jgi:hypothetical protein
VIDEALEGKRIAAEKWLDRLDEILREIGADPFAYASDYSREGFSQRLRLFADALGKREEDADRESIEVKAAHVLVHKLSLVEEETAMRVRMSVRLARWLGQRKERLGATSSVTESASWYVREGSFVDWARSDLRGGETESPLSAAYEQLLRVTRQQREAENERFASMLADWRPRLERLEPAIPIEDVLKRIVGPVARSVPTLFVVLDGMGVAVARELLEDLSRGGWTLLRPGAKEPVTSAIIAAVGAIPSVTEVCRATLLAGEITRGTSASEKERFASNRDLLAASRSNRPPLLFHKGDLTEPGTTELSREIRDAVRATENRVVGVVINAIDDFLAKSDEVRPRWTLGYFFQFLPALLNEARQVGRAVILGSDHGHVLDADSELRRSEFGDRWRVGDNSDLSPGERLFSGRRVQSAAAASVVVPWSERVRYGPKKNGYHGGVSLQEIIAPVVVLAPPGIQVEGWEEGTLDYPDWWEQVPASEEVSLFVELGKAPQRPLFQLQPMLSTAEPEWIRELLRSPMFKAQKKIAGRAAPTDERARRILQALAERGGKLTRRALAARLGEAEVRLDGIIAAIQRLLNVDGYPVLSVDRPSDTVELNLELLAKQFELKSSSP